MNYAKSTNGLIHLINHAGGGEFTLCGDAFDIDAVCEGHGHSEDEEGASWKPHPHGPVTCPDCARGILQCRGIRIAPGVLD